MQETILPAAAYRLEDDTGCAYVIDDPCGRRICAAPRRHLSSYCAIHHSLCHIVSGSKAEIKRMREVEALATAVGGRRAQQGAGPSRRFLDRLEHAVRALS